MTTELIQLTNQPKPEEVGVRANSGEPTAESGMRVTRVRVPRVGPILFGSVAPGGAGFATETLIHENKR